MPRKTILPKQIIRRAYSIFFIFIIGYIVLVYRIIDIQFVDSDLYQEKIENQNTRKIELNSGRGTIYDRNKKPLTDTKISKIIVVPKTQILNDNETKDLLNKIGSNAQIIIDGRVSFEVMPKLIEAGADVLVAGSKSIFRKGFSYLENYQEAQNVIKKSLGE